MTTTTTTISSDITKDVVIVNRTLNPKAVAQGNSSRLTPTDPSKSASKSFTTPKGLDFFDIEIKKCSWHSYNFSNL